MEVWMEAGVRLEEETTLTIPTCESSPKSKLLELTESSIAQWCLTLCDPMDYTVDRILRD